jgi:MSHA pilin protein MshC
MRSRGFTLTELVVVIIIATVLAAFAAARISTQGFETEGFANQTIAMVRYAQKIAISQRRTVAVVVTPGTPGSIRICYTDTSCSGGDVRQPSSTDPLTRTSKSNVTVAGASFTFSALGKPSAAATITISGDGSHTLTVEAETGYVH